MFQVDYQFIKILYRFRERGEFVCHTDQDDYRCRGASRDVVTSKMKNGLQDVKFF